MNQETAKPLVELIDSTLRKLNFRLLEAGDRGDAWEYVWGASAPQAGKDRYVVVAVLPVELHSLSLEVWAGADNGSRYERHLIRALAGIRPEDLMSDIVVETILAAAKAAARRAVILSESSLANSRLRQ